MKKLGLLVTPLMAISFLVSCGNNNKYTLTFNCTNCKVLDENKKEVTSVEIVPASLYTTYIKFYFHVEAGYKKPLKSLIKVEKTNKNEEVDFEYNPLTGEIDIPIIDNLTITASSFNKTLEECTWAEINEISTTGRAKELFDIYNPEKPELNCKRVQLKHQDKNGDGTDKISEGELYQTVRIIGFNEDYTELPTDGSEPDPNKSIGITFEFADLISDENGYSLATYWNDTSDGSNYSYKDSTIRKALNGETNDINWFRYYGEKDDTEGECRNRYFAKEDNYKKSILNMLPDELIEEGILKTTSKYININNGSGWNEETVKDKLFLLSPAEMGRDRWHEEQHTIAYSYYDGADNNRRIKHQINWHEGARTAGLVGDDLAGQCKGDKNSYAGYNDSTADNGGDSWSRSPRTNYNDVAWCIRIDGDFHHFLVSHNAFAVVPAFCI